LGHSLARRVIGHWFLATCLRVVLLSIGFWPLACASCY
jgi:hypothetical protein